MSAHVYILYLYILPVLFLYFSSPILTRFADKILLLGNSEIFGLEVPSEQGLRGEYQLCNFLGDKAQEVITQHRQSFVTLEDFKALAAAGMIFAFYSFAYIDES